MNFADHSFVEHRNIAMHALGQVNNSLLLKQIDHEEVLTQIRLNRNK